MRMPLRVLLATLLFFLLFLDTHTPGAASERRFREGLGRYHAPGCNDVTDAQRIVPPWARFYSIEDRRCQLIEGEEQWCAFWAEASGSTCDPDVVDWDHEVVVVRTMGARPNSCFRITIDKICRESDAMSLNVLVTENQDPVPGCLCFQTETTPLSIVRVARPVTRATCYSQFLPYDCR